MLATQRLPFASKCCSATFSTSVAEGLYEVLGVKSSASTEDIKSAFRKKAKAHHPDVNGATSTHFAVILRAYQVLSDPAKRKLYDLEHDAASSQLLRHVAAQQRSSEGQHMQYSWQWVNDLQDTRPARQGSNVDRLRAELAVEFREALLHAYHGPAVDMSARRLPAAFEADERSDGASPDILQLLSGRQLLGVVRERKDALLAGSEAHAPLEPAAAPPRQLQDGPAAAEGRRWAAARQGSDAACCDSTAARGPEAAAAANRKVPQRRVLELLLGDDDDVAAVAVRQQTGGGAPTIEVFQEGRLIYSEADGAVVKPLAAAAAAGSCGGGKRQRQTHRAVVSRTPLVKHLDWVALRGTGGLKKERVVGRARRAWLPPSATWLFKPRNATHTTGGWYFETLSYDQGLTVSGREHPAYLAPTAMVLRAAFETLEAESETKQEARKAVASEPRGIWRRLKSKLVG